MIETSFIFEILCIWIQINKLFIKSFFTVITVFLFSLMFIIDTLAIPYFYFKFKVLIIIKESPYYFSL